MGFIAESIYRTKTNTSPPECSYFGGQMGDKTGENLQISELKVINLQK